MELLLEGADVAVHLREVWSNCGCGGCAGCAGGGGCDVSIDGRTIDADLAADLRILFACRLERPAGCDSPWSELDGLRSRLTVRDGPVGSGAGVAEPRAEDDSREALDC